MLRRDVRRKVGKEVARKAKITPIRKKREDYSRRPFYGLSEPFGRSFTPERNNKRPIKLPMRFVLQATSTPPEKGSTPRAPRLI